jgi:hypothetical protein
VRLPDFFIIGAPKCGTNALYTYLGEHPRVFMPELKEPQYFCRDLPGLAQVDGHDDYTRLFELAPPDAVVGEASVWYLYSDVAVPGIRAANPEAKIIVILRNPIDAAYSLHAQFLRSLKENEVDFEMAWKLHEERRHGRKLPRYCPERRCVQYREVYSFGLQVERLLESVPSHQLKVLIFEEFFADVQRGYSELLEFLNLEPHDRRKFGVANPNRAARSQTVTRLLAAATTMLPGDLMIYRRALKALGIQPLRLLRRLNTVPATRPPLGPELRRDLARDLAGDVRRLESVLGRSLACWTDFGPASVFAGGVEFAVR